MNNKMAMNIHVSTIESKKQNRQTSRTEMDSQRTFPLLPYESRVVGMGEKVNGLSTNLLLQNSQGDVKDSIGNIVNSILITMYGVTWV